MNLEMKSIKHFASGSQETYCYTAVVYLDGKPFADVSNDGHGGSDYVHPHDKSPLIKVKGFDQKFEYWCCDQVTNFLDKKELKRRLNRCVVAQIKEDGELRVCQWNKPKGKPDWLLKEMIKKENSDVTILNDLSEADALDIWRTV